MLPESTLSWIRIHINVTVLQKSIWLTDLPKWILWHYLFSIFPKKKKSNHRAALKSPLGGCTGKTNLWSPHQTFDIWDLTAQDFDKKISRAQIDFSSPLKSPGHGSECILSNSKNMWVHVTHGLATIRRYDVRSIERKLLVRIDSNQNNTCKDFKGDLVL